MSLDGDVMAVGSEIRKDDVSSVFVYRFRGGMWRLVRILQHSRDGGMGWSDGGLSTKVVVKNGKVVASSLNERIVDYYRLYQNQQKMDC